MSSVAQNSFEIERRGIMWTPLITLNDGITSLGYDGNPNSVIDGNTPGETWLYSLPVGQFYKQSDATLWWKSGAPNSWINLGGAGGSEITNLYQDFFLPSRDEMVLMHNNLHAHGIGNFSNDFYWTSTEQGTFLTSVVDFSTGTGNLSGQKNGFHRIRPARTFISTEDLALGTRGETNGWIFHKIANSNNNTFTYFEALENDLEVGGSSTFQWGFRGVNISGAAPTSSGIGTGKENTINLIDFLEDLVLESDGETKYEDYDWESLTTGTADFINPAGTVFSFSNDNNGEVAAALAVNPYFILNSNLTKLHLLESNITSPTIQIIREKEDKLEYTKDGVNWVRTNVGNSEVTQAVDTLITIDDLQALGITERETDAILVKLMDGRSEWYRYDPKDETPVITQNRNDILVASTGGPWTASLWTAPAPRVEINRLWVPNEANQTFNFYFYMHEDVLTEIYVYNRAENRGELPTGSGSSNTRLLKSKLKEQTVSSDLSDYDAEISLSNTIGTNQVGLSESSERKVIKLEKGYTYWWRYVGTSSLWGKAYHRSELNINILDILDLETKGFQRSYLDCIKPGGTGTGLGGGRWLNLNSVVKKRISFSPYVIEYNEETDSLDFNYLL